MCRQGDGTSQHHHHFGHDLWIMIINIRKKRREKTRKRNEWKKKWREEAQGAKKKIFDANITCHSYSRCSSSNIERQRGATVSHTTYSLDFHFYILIRRARSFLFSFVVFPENTAAEFKWNIYDRIGIIHERCGCGDDIIIFFFVFAFFVAAEAAAAAALFSEVFAASLRWWLMTWWKFGHREKIRFFPIRDARQFPFAVLQK